ncbi:DUF6193 family natural product biosynthesis protein [Actinomadura rifamycini]|uniref:DUF6193 family natural product biosynthesis protein n=1 Tax=Actinomadura rifamycini TaxID=31962 RepID=UPI0012FB417B|nr:DUF6193 family natural product biosynthesis protein [Actinomadura rifamycini]
MMTSERDPLRHATIKSVLSHRGELSVSAWHFERRWWVVGSANNGNLINGVTDDLDQLLEVIEGWAKGAGLNEIANGVPIDILTGRGEVPDGNLPDVIAAEWQFMLKESRQIDWPEYRALIEVAYAEPKIRRLYPYTSHWALCFSATPYPFTRSFVTLIASRDGGYTVRKRLNGPELARVATPAEAVAMAVARLPKDLG